MKGNLTVSMRVETNIDPDMAANARRALSAGLPLMAWPPAVGARVHYNSGWPHTSWTAEVRGVVDGKVAVLRKTCPAFGKTRWDLLRRFEADIFKVRVGRLPRALTRQERDLDATANIASHRRTGR